MVYPLLTGMIRSGNSVLSLHRRPAISLGSPGMAFRVTLLLLVWFGVGQTALGGFVFSTPAHSDTSQLPQDLSHKGRDMGEQLQIVSRLKRMYLKANVFMTRYCQSIDKVQSRKNLQVMRLRTTILRKIAVGACISLVFSWHLNFCLCAQGAYGNA